MCSSESEAEVSSPQPTLRARRSIVKKADNEYAIDGGCKGDATEEESEKIEKLMEAADDDDDGDTDFHPNKIDVVPKGKKRGRGRPKKHVSVEEKNKIALKMKKIISPEDFVRGDNTADDMNNNGRLESVPPSTTINLICDDDDDISKDEEERIVVGNIGENDDDTSKDDEESKMVNIIPSNTIAKISNVKSLSKIVRATPTQPRMLRPIRPKSEKKRLVRGGGLFPRVPFLAHNIGATITRPRLPPPHRRTVPGYPPVMSPQSALLYSPVPPSPSKTVLSKLLSLGVSVLQRQSPPPPPPSLHNEWNIPPGITISRSPRSGHGSAMTMSTLASALHMLGEREGQKRMVSYMLTEQQIRALRLLGVGDGAG